MMICRVAAQLKIGTMPSKMSHHLEKVNFQFRVQAVYLLPDGKSYYRWQENLLLTCYHPVVFHAPAAQDCLCLSQYRII